MAALIRQRINAVWSRHSATASDAPRPAHIAQTAALLLLVNRLETRVRAEAKDVAQPDISDKLASSRLDSDDSDEMPPAYTAQDPAAAPTSRTASQMWHGYLSRATARLELFRTEILPLAATTSAAPESHPWDLPLHLVPPLDVCIAWAAKIGETKKEAEAEWVSAGTMGSISLRAWRFPLEAIADSFNPETLTSAYEEQVRQWETATSTPFYAPLSETSSESASPAVETDVLAKGLVVQCPNPACSFSAPLNFFGHSQCASVRHSSRGLAEPGWKRSCKDCGLHVSIDTLVGRKFVEDLQRWCDAEYGFDQWGFSGLLLDPETGKRDPSKADEQASVVLNPLFGPALSHERKTRSSHLDPAQSSNSLSAAMSKAAAATFATSPSELGNAKSWSMTRMASWLHKYTLLANPSTASNKDWKHMPQTFSNTSDVIGGGFSQAGPNFNAYNPDAERDLHLQATTAAEHEARLKEVVHRLTAPYLELVNNGLPSPTATLSKRPTSRTEVVLNAAGSARRMSRFARTLQDWAKTQAQACEEGFAQRAENQYRAWIEGASMENPKKGVERIAFQRSISEQGTEVALAWAAHVLANGPEVYRGDMLLYLGIVPEHSWSRQDRGDALVPPMMPSARRTSSISVTSEGEKSSGVKGVGKLKRLLSGKRGGKAGQQQHQQHQKPDRLGSQPSTLNAVSDSEEE